MSKELFSTTEAQNLIAAEVAEQKALDLRLTTKLVKSVERKSIKIYKKQNVLRRDLLRAAFKAYNGQSEHNFYLEHFPKYLHTAKRSFLNQDFLKELEELKIVKLKSVSVSAYLQIHGRPIVFEKLPDGTKVPKYFTKTSGNLGQLDLTMSPEQFFAIPDWFTPESVLALIELQKKRTENLVDSELNPKDTNKPNNHIHNSDIELIRLIKSDESYITYGDFITVKFNFSSDTESPNIKFKTIKEIENLKNVFSQHLAAEISPDDELLNPT